MTLYLKVTTDRYQLPVAVADNAKALSKMTGVTLASLYSMLSRNEGGFMKIKIEESEEDENGN